MHMLMYASRTGFSSRTLSKAFAEASSEAADSLADFMLQTLRQQHIELGIAKLCLTPGAKQSGCVEISRPLYMHQAR